MDVDDAELYVPMMSFVTYALLCALETGIKG